MLKPLRTLVLAVSTLFLIAAFMAAQAPARKPDSITEKYRAVGATVLGRPMGAEKRGAGGGRVQLYERGGIYWSPRTGAHQLNGAIYAAYKKASAEAGALGYPVSDAVTTANGTQALFQHGLIASKGAAILPAGQPIVRIAPWVTISEDDVSVDPGRRITVQGAGDSAELDVGLGGTTVRCGCFGRIGQEPKGKCKFSLRAPDLADCGGSCNSCLIIPGDTK